MVFFEAFVLALLLVSKSFAGFEVVSPSISYSRSDAAHIEVGENIQVSKALSNLSHDEVLVATDPSHVDNMIGCGIVSFPASPTDRTIVYASRDGGLSWVKALEGGFGDPACTYGPDGIAFFTSIAGDDNRFRLLVYYSADGGGHWKRSRFLEGDKISDRDYVAADQSPHSRYRGRVYISGALEATDFSGNTLGGIGLYHSNDGGQSFGHPTVAIPEQNAKGYQACNLALLSDGSVVVLVNNMLKYNLYEPPNASIPNGNLRLLRSRDGGATFLHAVKIADIHRDWRFPNDVIPAVVAADSGDTPFRDRIYVAWVEYDQVRTRIFLSYSADKGSTWSLPRVVSDDGPVLDPAHRFNSTMPSLSVNKSGVVGLTWYDRRDNPDNIGYYVRFSASLNGGEDWSPSIRVSSKPRTFGDPRDPYNVEAYSDDAANGGPIGVRFEHGDWLTGGHTSGLAADARGDFHALWVDNRTGVHQMWTAPIIVSGTVTNVDGALLAHYQDVSAKVKVQWTSVQFNEATGVLSVHVWIQNASSQIIHAPIKARVSGVTSDFGPAEFVSTSAPTTGTVGLMELTALLRGGTFRPGQRLEIGQMEFHLARFSRGSPLDNYDLLKFNLRVYGGK